MKHLYIVISLSLSFSMQGHSAVAQAAIGGGGLPVPGGGNVLAGGGGSSTGAVASAGLSAIGGYIAYRATDCFLIKGTNSKKYRWVKHHAGMELVHRRTGRPVSGCNNSAWGGRNSKGRKVKAWQPFN